ncbi:magnesium transporter [Desulfoferrobacter suflitae]|uniref:magnesium transporter n=1 Tax=Desulfoferrobacter suflitae TaxID=2865782 RepID=UPI002164099D|nr:magnesium transporter [Desulfoferrobacter suflitae]MCK8600882.1 magnesium transporter [Desulfoferrobacter suflitae]
MAERYEINRLREWITLGDRDALLQIFTDLHPADSAELLAGLSPQEVAKFIELVGVADALTVFEFVPFEIQKETLLQLPRSTVAELISLMSPDDRADLVEELDEKTQEKLLALIIKAERQNILKLITYPEDSAGAYMTTDYALLRPDATIRAALDQLRFQATTKETIYYVYVVDQARRLIGFVSLRDLIMARPDIQVRDIMNRNVISVRFDEDIEDVAKEMSHYDFLAMPVVDADDRLIGIITYDDVFDIMNEEATEDMYLLANLDTDEKVFSPLPRSVKLRVPWLLVNLCTALVASYTVSLFSETISSFVVLASLMPIVAGIGGNAGTQSLTVVVRALALGEIKVEGNWPVLLKQVGVGLFSGLICGLVLAAIAYYWHKNLWLSVILWMAMTSNLIIAGLVGSMVPIALRKLKLDPALGSSIFVTMATDTGGFFIFLGLSTLLLHHLVGG